MTALHRHHLVDVSTVEFFGKNTVRLEADHTRTFRVNDTRVLAEYCDVMDITLAGNFIPSIPSYDLDDSHLEVPIGWLVTLKTKAVAFSDFLMDGCLADGVKVRVSLTVGEAYDAAVAYATRYNGEVVSID